MKQVKTADITALVEQLCIEACCVITEDINNKFKSCLQTETSPLGKEILGTLIENARIAREDVSGYGGDCRFCTHGAERADCRRIH